MESLILSGQSRTKSLHRSFVIVIFDEMLGGADAIVESLQIARKKFLLSFDYQKLGRSLV